MMKSLCLASKRASVVSVYLCVRDKGHRGLHAGVGGHPKWRRKKRRPTR